LLSFSTIVEKNVGGKHLNGLFKLRLKPEKVRKKSGEEIETSESELKLILMPEPGRTMVNEVESPVTPEKKGKKEKDKPIHFVVVTIAQESGLDRIVSRGLVHGSLSLKSLATDLSDKEGLYLIDLLLKP